MAEPNKYTSDQLEKALRKADAAGDAEAAREIAKALREQSAIENVDQYAKPMPFADAINVQSKQGFDWGLTDESKGAQATLGLPKWADRGLRMATPGVPIANIALGVGGLTAEATGNTPQAYTEARDAERADIAKAWEDRPVTSFGSQMASAAAYPGGAMKAGAPIAKESLKMALIGALQGGTYGYAANDGDTADRVEGGKIGGALGGAFGGALPTATAFTTPIVRTGKQWASKGVDAAGRLFGKDLGAEAGHAQQVAKAAVERSMNRSGMTPEKIMEAIDKFGDKPAVLAEVIGQDAVNALTALTRAPGSTAQKAQDIIAERFGGFAGRAADDLRATTGLTDKQIMGNFDDEIAKRQAEAAPAYQSLFEQQGGVASPRLDQLSGTNTLKGKIESAKKAASDLAVAQTRDPASVTRMEVLDTAKRSLDDDIAKAVKNQDREEAMRLTTMQTALLNELDSLTGGQYAAARDLGGEAPRIINAFDQGTKAMRPSVSRNAVNEQTAALRPQDKSAYAAGVASKIDEDLANGRMAPQRFRLPANQEKVTAAFGENAGGEFTKRMQAEAELRDLGARWGPRMNSVTGTVTENSGGGMAEEAASIAFSLARGDKVGLIQKAMRFMRQRGFSEKERNAMGDLLLSNPQEGLKRLGIQLPAPGGGAPTANAFAGSTRGKAPEPSTARDPQNVKAQFEWPTDIESYDAAGNARFKPGSKGEAMARSAEWDAPRDTRSPNMNIAGGAAGAAVGAIGAPDMNQDGVVSAQERVVAGLVTGAGGAALPSIMRRSGVGIDRNTTGTFGGMLAKNADQQALLKAQRMEREGAARDVIWSETGWFKGPDGKWRFEIDDSGVDTAQGILGPKQTSLGGLITDADAGGNYPDIADVKVGRAKLGGYSAYNPHQDTMVIGGVGKKAASGALHERQHAIQKREGFAGGENAVIPSFVFEDPADQAAWNLLLRDSNDIKQSVNISELMLRDRRGQPMSANEKAYVDRWKQIQEETPPLMARAMNPQDSYWRSAGEVEARNVQARHRMTPDERRATPPWETQDVPFNQQFVRNSAGYMQGSEVHSRGKLPKLMKDVPKGTRKPGDRPNLSGTIARGQKETTGTPIAKATGDQGTVAKQATADAQSMLQKGERPDDIMRRTGMAPITYRGKTVFRETAPDMTYDDVMQAFYENVGRPPEEWPEWMTSIMMEMGETPKGLVLGGPSSPMRLGGPTTPLLERPKGNNVPRAALLGGLGAVGAGTAYYMGRKPKESQNAFARPK